MTTDEWKRLPPGTHVRRRLPGATGPNQYIDTRTKRSAYHLGIGTLVVALEGVSGAVPVRELEVIPMPGDSTGCNAASPPQSPYPYPGAGP